VGRGAVDRVHPAARGGFSRSAEAYDRARPEYPAVAIDWLVKRLRLEPRDAVLDLAAGTGKLSRPLAARGLEVVAVEPLAEMRRRIGGSIRALDGAAEAIPLPDASVAGVVVGQAFHWFAHEAALAEMHRVLRPGSALGLVWNRRRLEDPIHAAVEELIGPHRGETPAYRSDSWREPLAQSPLFGSLEERTFDNTQELDARTLVDRIASTSFIAVLPDGPRADVLERARALAAGGTVTLRYVTEVQVADRRG
jgi:ubiquinone/menaquinone biosynthesis C-methylase UbiE